MIARLLFTLIISVALFNIHTSAVSAAPSDRVSSLKLEQFTKLHSNWKLQGNRLVAVFKFSGGFKGAVNFVQQLVQPADAMNHHPDLSLSYNTLTISLTTHDAGGITTADLKLAETIQKLYVGTKK